MNATLLLQLWGSGQGGPAERGALLHRAALGTEDAEAALDATPGQRTHALLRWRAALFGEPMECIADCPGCAERVEFTLRGADLHPGHYPQGTLEVDMREAAFHVRARVPRWREIGACGGDGRALLESCVIASKRGRTRVRASELPAHVLDRLEAELRNADPLLDLSIQLECPACAHAWAAPFDVAAYCWTELDRWGQRLLATIHRLARAYGWSEREVLGLPAWRRERYLQLLAP